MSAFKLATGLLSVGLVLGLAGCGDDDSKDSDPSSGDVEDCSNGADDDGDGAADCDDSDCASEAACLIPDEDCSNQVDDDEDGAVDCDDQDCQNDDACYVFEAYAFGMTFIGGFDGEGLVAYAGQDSSGAPFESEPFVIVDFYTEEYFETNGDERYTCTWYGDITELAVTSMPTAIVEDGSAGPDLWMGFEVGITVSMIDDGSGQMVPATNCESFDAAVWGAEDPTTVIESLVWGIGAGPLDALVEDSISTSYPDEWADYLGAELYGGYYGAGAAQGTITASGVNYCFGAELEDVDGVATIVYDENGDSIARELGEDYTDDVLPPYTLINCNSWYLPYVAMMGI